MSGLEILGVAASAVQVAQVSLAIVTSLTSLFNQIRDAPKLVQTRLVQVQTLAEISRLIASMPQLQTAGVEAILMSCSKDAVALKDVLEGLVVEKEGSSIKKWAKSVGGVVLLERIAFSPASFSCFTPHGAVASSLCRPKAVTCIVLKRSVIGST